MTKLIVMIEVPRRTSYEELKDVTYSAEFEYSATLHEMFNWAAKTFNKYADDGKGPDGISVEEAIEKVKIGKKIDHDTTT